MTARLPLRRPTGRIPESIPGPSARPDASGGTLKLSDGSYTAFAQATITNDLIPAGDAVGRGTYSGTYNSQTGQVTSNSKAATS